MKAPLISVVTSVYCGGSGLRASLESILSQSVGDLELVVVDDGSTDGSRDVLEDLACRDVRVRVLAQENRGLTQALARGCAEARGEFIARHDADDLSLPDRLARQVECLRSEPGLTFVSCWTRVVGPLDELLFESQPAAGDVEATAALTAGQASPWHGSVLMRAEAFRRAGGYRPQFRYAQDWDLWLRLVDHGNLVYVPETLYVFRVSEGSLSALRGRQQRRLASLARRCREARLAGRPEEPLLAEAAAVSEEPVGRGVARGSGGNSYFVGKCLLDRRDVRALPYLRRAVRATPLSWRPWAALLLARLLCRALGEGRPA